jgi:hypothetical protein
VHAHSFMFTRSDLSASTMSKGEVRELSLRKQICLGNLMTSTRKSTWLRVGHHVALTGAVKWLRLRQPRGFDLETTWFRLGNHVASTGVTTWL